jgi:hypothetical protein
MQIKRQLHETCAFRLHPADRCSACLSAAPNCLALGGTLELDDEGNPSELRTLENDRLRLRGAGYDALSVERWGGCIKLTHRQDGRLVTEYLDPDTLQPVS